MPQRFIPAVGLLLLILGLWPNAGSLYDLTGEEELPAQLRGLIHWVHTAVRPQPDLAPGDVLDHADVVPFGVNTFLEQEVLPEARERSLQLAQEAGFHYIRQQFPWEDIEIHGKGDFVDRRNDPAGISAWAKYDNIVELAEKYGLEIIARLDNPPAWSRASGDEAGTRAPPDNFEDYGDFVEAVVSRYKGRITYFQLWNEPNIYPEWGEQPVNPEAYTELLCTAFRRTRGANPDAIVLAGALAPTIALDGRDLNDLVYLQRMYRAGAGECFDIFSAQGYGLWSGPTDQRLRPVVINYSHVLLLRDVMVQYGDAEKAIWISEAGWNTVPENLPALYGRVDQEQQARYAVQAYRRAQTDWPWVGVINTWFLKRPSDVEKDQPSYYFRLLEPDFSPLPAFNALADYAGSAEATSLESRPSAAFTWQRARPWLSLTGAAVLFIWLLSCLASSLGLE